MDKPFALFCGQCYYPAGGMDDYYGSYATQEEALAVAKDPNLLHPEYAFPITIDWYQIVNVRTMQVVAYGP